MNQAYLKDNMYYDNGNLYRHLKKRGCMYGRPIGSKTARGYTYVQIKKKRTYLHRLVWIFHYGEIPKDKMIDHINRNKEDNRIENLRVVTNAENQHNCKMRTNNTSGHKNVTRSGDGKKWGVGARINGRRKHFGYFVDLVDAVKQAQIIEEQRRI